MFLPVDDHLLNTVAFGAGPATLVAHGGWVGSWELWQQPFELLQDRWRCISYDHRGSGVSTFPPEAISPEALVTDLIRVLDHYEVERCLLAGESLGSITCLLAAEREPSRFAGLVLVAGAPMVAEAVVKPLVDGSRVDYPNTVREFVDACVPEPDSEHVRRWGRQIMARADPEAAARLFESHYEARVVPDIARISTPTLLLHGDRDAIVPLAVGEAVAGAMPNAELVVLPETGHVPTMTRPASVAAEIDRWAASL